MELMNRRPDVRSTGGEPSRSTSRTEQLLCYESLDCLKGDGTGREKINKYPTRKPFAGCLCYICMHYRQIDVLY